MWLKRLEEYFREAQKHIELIEESLTVLPRPIYTYENLSQLQKFALNALIFRFSKLQDLLGAKIFRTYLEFSGYATEGKNYFDILKEIEKEKIVDVDTWNELRELRNIMAHKYPQELEEMLESINLFIEKSALLIQISQKIREHFDAINAKRG